MMKRLLFILFLYPLTSSSQNFTIQPYLQNASPTSITIMWEYSNWDVAYIEWGNTTGLGNLTATTFEITNAPACVFTAKLSGLQTNTKYYYQVTTGNSTSAMFDFYTPANKQDEKPINIVAMSDMQIDGNNPTKFTEIINDGIINYIQNNYTGDINNNLDMVLIPGDLVSTSPASTLLPPNLPVGVIQIVNKDHLPAPYAFVQLIASPSAIDWVQIRKVR